MPLTRGIGILPAGVRLRAIEGLPEIAYISRPHRARLQKFERPHHALTAHILIPAPLQRIREHGKRIRDHLPLRRLISPWRKNHTQVLPVIFIE